jgi:O-antigen ligase
MISAISRYLEPEEFGVRLVDASLYVALAFVGLAIMAGVAYEEVWLPIAVVGTFVAIPLVLWIVKSDLRIVFCLIVLFVTVVRYKAGIQVGEVLFGLGFFGFLFYWTIRKLITNPNGFAQNSSDYLLLAYLAFATLTIPFSVVNGADIGEMFSEYVALMMLAMYFPVRDLAAKEPRAIRWIIAAVGILAVYVVARNLFTYAARLGSAEHLWQIATGRVTHNEHVLMMMTVGAVAVLGVIDRFKHQLGVLVIAGICGTGVIIGQSRALWLATLLGLGVVFLFVTKKNKVRLLLFGSASLGAVLLAAYVVMGGEMLSVVIAGLMDRFFSLETAATQDVSLVNRFLEMDAVFRASLASPIIGHGFGVPYDYYSIVYHHTHVQSFVHSGYLGLFYRHGLLGIVLFFGFCLMAFMNGVRLIRKRGTIPREDFAVGLWVCGAFVAISLVANSENPLATSDKTLLIGIVSGLAAGAFQRNRHTEQPKEVTD